MTYEDRLADYLAGTLAPDDKARVEAELASDADLRATLAAMQRADAALARVTTPSLPTGFDERLRAALAPEIARHVASDDGVVVPLLKRLTTGPRWVTHAAAAAAGLVVIAGIGLATATMLGGGETDPMAALDAGVDHEEADDAVASLAMPESAMPHGPVVVASDRTVSAAALDEVALHPQLEALAAEALELAEGEQRSAEYRDALAAVTMDGSEPRALRAPEVAEDDSATELSPPSSQAVMSCFDVIEGEPPAIVGYVEHAVNDDGDQVLIYGLVTAPNGRYDTIEAVAVYVDDCSPATELSNSD